MENQMELFFEKIKEQMSVQTKQITELVTRIEMLQHKINFLEDNKRRHNLILFGVSESEQEGSLLDYVKTTIEKETKITIQPHEINTVQRLGAKGKGTRPLLVSFTSIWKRNLILKNKNRKHNPTKSTITIKEDFSKDVLLKRKELIPQLLQEKEKGKIAYLKKDKLIIIDPKEANPMKRKRNPKESPNDKTNTNRPSFKIPNTSNIFDYMTRARSSSCSDLKN
ncbi:unnamed protein product [Euphydryas editha]|uniref:Endonuclease-reverse transcriptase n=1 Tax=Euphydryas editha TaxID=104508 RepID=A0AAU9UY50_EUPED|nr:unnamed protein product [Euphydryas editha]